MKFGVNPTDRNEIKRLTEQGWNSQEISDALQVDKTVVERFMPEVKDGTQVQKANEKGIKKKSQRKKKKKSAQKEPVLDDGDKGDD